MTGDRYNVALVRLHIFLHHAYLDSDLLFRPCSSLYVFLIHPCAHTYMAIRSLLHPAILLVRGPVEVCHMLSPCPLGAHGNPNSLVLKKFRPSRYAFCFVVVSSIFIRLTRWLPGIAVSSRRISQTTLKILSWSCRHYGEWSCKSAASYSKAIKPDNPFLLKVVHGLREDVSDAYHTLLSQNFLLPFQVPTAHRSSCLSWIRRSRSIPRSYLLVRIAHA